MSTSAYYSFIGPGGPNAEACINDTAKSSISTKRTTATTATMTTFTQESSVNQIDLHRQSAMSPSSNRTSTSNSSSSLNSQFNSLTPNSTASSSSSSTFSSSASSTASTTNLVNTTASAGQITNANSTPQRSLMAFTQRDLIRQSSLTPTQQIGSYNQLHHSYTLNSLEPKPLKPFKSQSAYIEAMKEDLAEWLNSIYNELELTPENFFSKLETGAIICRHANNVTQMGRNVMIERASNSSDAASSGSDDINENSLNHEMTTNSVTADLSSPSPEYDHEHLLGVVSTERRGNRMNGASTQQPNQFYPRHRHSTTNSSISSITTTCSSGVASKQRLSLTGTSLGSGLRSDKLIDWFRVKLLTYKNDARPGTFFSRDNICQFILWCRSLNILECLLFETDDLVARKNEKSFILCLLEVARIGFKVGMPTPLIIQLEQEIDREIENDAKLQKQLEEAAAERKRCQTKNDSQIYFNDNDLLEEGSTDNGNKDGASIAEAAVSEQEERQLELNNDKQANDEQPGGDSSDVEDNREEISEEDFGPKPQVITNDLLSLHERVVQLLCQCTCPTQFPMVRIGDGKYKVGDKLIIFVRILRRHIMVRVGGGWQELSEFLRQKDPCRTKSQNQNYFKQQNSPNGTSYKQAPTSPSSLSTTILLNTPTTPTSATTMFSLGITSIPVSRSRLLGSSHHMNKSYRSQRHSPSGARISGSASMSWLSHNS